MRYTVPWLPPPGTRAAKDDDELTGNALMLALLVGTIVGRHAEPVSADTLALALAALFASVFSDLDDDEVAGAMSGAVMLATVLGLVELTVDECFRATETQLNRSLTVLRF